MASIRFCLLAIMALSLGLTSGWQEPNPGAQPPVEPARNDDLDSCICFISVELVPPRERLPEGVKFHLPDFVRARVGDLIDLIAREGTTNEITSADATIQGVAVERVGKVYYGGVTPSGSVIQVPMHGPPHVLLRAAKTGKATIEATINFKGGRKETRKIDVDVTEKREPPKEQP